MTTTTVPAGAITPPAPAGTAWRFTRQHRDQSIELTAIPTDDQHDPQPPPGCAWRVVVRHGQRVYIATPHPFTWDDDRFDA